jgi:hypothetical protein
VAKDSIVSAEGGESSGRKIELGQFWKGAFCSNSPVLSRSSLKLPDAVIRKLSESGLSASGNAYSGDREKVRFSFQSDVAHK